MKVTAQIFAAKTFFELWSGYFDPVRNKLEQINLCTIGTKKFVVHLAKGYSAFQ